jgi:hypothetical protein
MLLHGAPMCQVAKNKPAHAERTFIKESEGNLGDPYEELLLQARAWRFVLLTAATEQRVASRPTYRMH